jgi:glycosyltransferase involved in cell wall biosynthesis
LIISVVGPTWPYRGGISHYNTLLCEHLARRHTVKLWGFRRQYPRWLFPGRDDRDPSQRPLQTASEPVLDPLAPWSWVRTARRIVDAQSDLLILHWWVTFWAPPFATVAARVRRRGIPVLYLCHNVLPHELKPWDRPLARLALAQGDGYIATSKGQEQRLTELLPDARVYSGFHPTYTALAELGPERSRAEACRHLGLDPDKPVALFFGFVRPYKGLRYLIESLPAVLERVDLQLVIAGEFWEDKQIYLDQAVQLGVDRALTIADRYVPNEELGLYFGAADVVVLPYLSVTQSGIVQLAYGFGKPVITTCVGDLPEVVQHERTGLIVPPADASALSAALLWFFALDIDERERADGVRQRMRDEVLAMRDRFSWARLEAIIDQMVRDVRGAGAGRTG